MARMTRPVPQSTRRDFLKLGACAGAAGLGAFAVKADGTPATPASKPLDPDLSAVVALKQRSHLPVIVDPSHAAGLRSFVAPLARAALAVGADGLLIEVHDNPQAALCDGAQSLDLQQFDELMGDLRKRVGFENREM